MRDPLLKVAPWGALAALVGLGAWLLPSNEPSAAPVQPAVEAPPPAATASPALSKSFAGASSSAVTATATPLNAAQLTERAKQQLALNPAAALQDIAQADELASSADEAQSETRRVLEIHALVRLGKVGLARTLTDRFYRTFPNSARAAELERLTGYHPRP